MAEIHRPALGQEVAIGTLYDAKHGQFLPASVLPLSIPEGIITRAPCQTSQQQDISWSVGATHKDRFALMGIDADFAASVACDLAVPQGSGMFLKDGTSEKDIFQGNVRYIYNTCREYVELSNPDISHKLAQEFVSIADNRSTHFVVAANYGLQSIITMKHHLKDPEHKVQVEPLFSHDVRTVHDIAKCLPSLDFSDNTVDRRLALEYEFRLYTDIQKEYGICLQTLAILCTFVQKGPQQIRAASGQKGYPIVYTLLPLQFLSRLETTGIPDSIRTHVSVTDIDPVLAVFDQYNEDKERLDNYKLFIQGNKHYIPLQHFDDVNEAILRMSGYQNNFKVELKRRVLNVRNGIKNDHHIHELRHFNENNPERLFLNSVAMQQSEKINFITNAVNSGATYIGFNGLSLKDVALPHDSPIPFTFEFNDALIKNSSSWIEQHDAFNEVLWNPLRRCQVYIVDCDAPLQRKHLDCARFSQMQRENTASTQHEEQHYSSSEQKESRSEPVRRRRSRKCVARCPPEALDASTTQGFIEQRLFKMPCPGKSCDYQRDCKWTCYECYTPIEFCPGDDYLYCDCGRALCNTWRFRCNDESHGRDFDRPSSRSLDKHLKRSSRPLYRNILVLGETGVGKSTFINAFYNFLKFNSFDEAKAESKRKLQYVIPCRFSINVPSRIGSLDYETRDIRVGSRDDERDGTGGDSTTQTTSVYTMKYRNTTYRLFDTPGIGDTRGPEQDKENLRGIMASLRDYEELHGILILLKTNETRMTATFQFCFEELLSTIQRDAIPNIVFGFTHTMDSSYRPGGCLPILKRKLQDHANVDFVLGSETAYSFDAESFRYLAALYRGVERDDERTCRESWERARAEVLRFLQHIDGLKPHDVGQTISMDGVRQAVEQLMVPMVKVAQVMKDNIERLDRDVKELQDTRLTGDQLRKKLHLQRLELRAEKLDKPRTVCKNKKCCDLKTNPNGEVVTDYKWICHPDCKLPNVTEDSTGHPGLASCRAFKGGKGTCSNENCGHHWQEHVHILYELKEHKVQVKDTEVERRLKANTNDITVRQEGIRKIKDLQKEYEDERDQLRTAMVRFVAYLKKHAITAVNDRTENYYTELIKIEENKIQRAKDRRMNVDVNVKKLEGLKQDLDAYLELTETIKQNMRAPRDSSDELLTQEGVKKLIQDLYNLPHFGKNLENMKTVIVSSHATTHRERSRRRERSRGRRDVVYGHDVEDRDGGPSNRRERESSARRESHREGRPWLFWRS